MNKTKLRILSIILITGLSITNVHADGVYLICKAPSTGMAGKGGCIKAYYPTPKKVCSGKDGKTCSTSSLEDLCIKVGKKAGIPFNSFSSGVGTFKNEKDCLKKCEKEYGGKFKQFGGECFGMVSI